MRRRCPLPGLTLLRRNELIDWISSPFDVLFKESRWFVVRGVSWMCVNVNHGEEKSSLKLSAKWSLKSFKFTSPKAWT